MSRTLKFVAVVWLAAAPALAQTTTKPSNPAVPEGRSVDQKAAETQGRAAAQPQRPEPAVNIRVDLTITDQRGTAAPLSKSITMTMMDTASSRIRTGGDVRTPLGFRPVTLNVDASPRLHRDGKVRLDMTIEYRPTAAESDTEQSTTPTINESISVLLEDGKPLVISQSADPATDRRVKVEAKATIIR